MRERVPGFRRGTTSRGDGLVSQGLEGFRHGSQMVSLVKRDEPGPLAPFEPGDAAVARAKLFPLGGWNPADGAHDLGDQAAVRDNDGQLAGMASGDLAEGFQAALAEFAIALAAGPAEIIVFLAQVLGPQVRKTFLDLGERNAIDLSTVDFP